MLLLHICCAPCSAAVLEWLLTYGIHPVLFFFNPNIYSQREYKIRKNELMSYAKKIGLVFINGDYNHKLWLNTVEGLENQPERGIRCLECFKIRLLVTAQLAAEKKNYEYLLLYRLLGGKISNKLLKPENRLLHITLI